MADPLTLAAPCTAEIVERRSRFLAHTAPAATVAEAEAVIRAARVAAPAARHHCSAMILTGEPTPVTRSSDDGEPSGTAGMPILLALQVAGLVDVVAVVTRHVGGIKLGTVGLARAYGGAVSAALADARLLRRTELAVATLDVPHAEAGAMENALRVLADGHAGRVEPTVHGERGATLTVLLPPAALDALRTEVAAWSSGRLRPVITGTRTLGLPR